MKKKMIEGFPPLPVEKTKDKKFYVAGIDIKDLKGEKTLIVDIYRNLKKSLKTPVVRVVLTEREFANYDYAKERWNYQQIRNVETGYPESINAKTVAVRLEDEQLILDRFKGYSWDDWIDRIQSTQEDIGQKKRNEQERKRSKALEERIKNMPEIPQEFYSWCEEELFKREKYIFYKRKGRYAEFFCGCCGRTYRYATERKASYEGQFEHIVAVPKENTTGRCEKCGDLGIYKPVGRTRAISEKKNCYLMQKYGDQGGVVIRWLEIRKTSEAGEIPVYKDMELNRSFFLPETKKVQKDYQVYNGWIDRNEWWPHNIQGMNPIKLPRARIWPGSFEEIRGTILQYSGIEHYHEHYDFLNPTAYMEAYRELPAMEMISKMGMYKLTDRLAEGTWSWREIDARAVKPEDILMIRKNKIKKLAKEHGNREYHELLKMEKELGLELREEQEDLLVELGIHVSDLKILLRYMSLQKAINRIFAYAGIETSKIIEQEEVIGSCIVGRIQSMAGYYADYISMRETAGYDMTDEIILHPRNLKEEHDKMVRETNERQNEIRINKMNSLYQKIRENFQKISKEYAYENNKYCIRPAESAGEIILEGKELHHCVGGENYLREHDSGKGYILFLRPVAEKAVPFVTVEIAGTEIKQWHGINNSQPDKENIEKWLKKYTNNLKNKRLGMVG